MQVVGAVGFQQKQLTWPADVSGEKFLVDLAKRCMSPDPSERPGFVQVQSLATCLLVSFTFSACCRLVRQCACGCTWLQWPTICFALCRFWRSWRSSMHRQGGRSQVCLSLWPAAGMFLHTLYAGMLLALLTNLASGHSQVS